MKKWWWIIGISFGLLIVIAIGLRVSGVIGGEKPGKTVETSLVKLKTITEIVAASGRIQPEIEVNISSDVSGEIIELPVKEGDFVEEGELLCRIRPDLFQANIDQLEARLLTEKARLEQTRANLIRAQAAFKQAEDLFNKKLISELDYISARSDHEALKSSLKASEYTVKNAEAALRQAQEELRQTFIRAPMSGTISKLSVEKGERVVGSIQMSGTEILRIARMEQMEVEVRVNENDIVKVATGDSTNVFVEAYPDRTIKGLITEIANSADVSGSGTNEQVTDYIVKVRISSVHNQEYASTPMMNVAAQENAEVQDALVLKPGMSATVDIMTETVLNVPAVPIQAVTIRDFNKDLPDSLQKKNDLLIPEEDLRRVVFVVRNDTAFRTEVKTGISDDAHMQILSGVDAGEKVVIGSYKTLSEELSHLDRIKEKDATNTEENG